MTGSQDASEGAAAESCYADHVAALMEAMASLPAGPIADRYGQALQLAIEGMRPIRAPMQAYFADAMQERTESPMMGSPAGARLCQAYARLAREADDALREPAATQLGITLYCFHMLLLLFWLYDRSPGQAATRRLLGFAVESFKLLRPLFFLPMAPRAMEKLAEIMTPAGMGKGVGSIGAAAQDDAGDGQHQDLDIHRE